jgi:hypothetical protein
MKREPLVDPALPKIGDFIVDNIFSVILMGHVLFSFRNGIYRRLTIKKDKWTFGVCGTSFSSRDRKISLK